MKYFVEGREHSKYDKMKKGKWNNHIWCGNCPVQQAIEREGEG